MPLVVVVVVSLVVDDDFGLGQGAEGVDVQAVVSHPGVEGFCVAVVPGLTGWDETHPDLVFGPVLQDSGRSCRVRCHNAGPWGHYRVQRLVPTRIRGLGR